MSRIGKLAIPLPSGVSMEKKGVNIVVKGPKGSLEKVIPEDVKVTINSDNVLVEACEGKPNASAYHGLTRSLLANMVTGVSKGFERVLEINGIGYRVAVQGNKLNFTLGYSHPIEYELPPGVVAEVDKQTTLKLKGADKEVLGSMAANIRGLRGPEPYKGKGIKYAEERILRKAGKTGK